MPPHWLVRRHRVLWFPGDPAAFILRSRCGIAGTRVAGSAAAIRSSCSASEALMPLSPFALRMLDQEARALLTRLARLRPFALQESMLPAANLLPASQTAIEQLLMGGRRNVRQLVTGFIEWVNSGDGIRSSAEEA